MHLLKEIITQISDCVLLGDKGYLSATKQLDLFESANITLETLQRTNQKNIINNHTCVVNQEKE